MLPAPHAQKNKRGFQKELSLFLYQKFSEEITATRSHHLLRFFMIAVRVRLLYRILAVQFRLREVTVVKSYDPRRNTSSSSDLFLFASPTS